MKLHALKRPLCGLMIIGMGLQMSACGTVLYPERKGQIDGQIDPNVAILNGIGLLFFLVPGVVAFAVDFSNGTIYLPEKDDKASTPFEDTTYIVIHTDPENLSGDYIQEVVEQHTGRDLDLHSPRVRITPVNSLDHIAHLPDSEAPVQ